jgi:hypothetical protein
MSDLRNLDAFQLPVRDRVRHGLKRGALLGVYVFVLMWLLSVFRVRGVHSERLMSQPVTAAAIMIAGFAVAGGLLLALKPRVHNVANAIALGIVCSLPMWLGFVAGIWSRTTAALPFVGAISLLTGVIWGTMAWKGWHR